MDQGGTFTDCLGLSPSGDIRMAKLLSSPMAPVACIRRILQLGESDPVPPAQIRLGTTLATNALLERRGRRHALLTTSGFGDALAIGTQQRPDLFALRIEKPAALYSDVVEARGRLDARGDEIEPLDPETLSVDLLGLLEKGYADLAIVFLHGYAFPRHELQAAELARKLGFARVTCSHEADPSIGFTARGDTTTVDAYLTPLLAEYLAGLREQLPGSSLLLMQSGGGLCGPELLRGQNAILSGPAGGVVACAHLAQRAGYPCAIGFDMGGTSTDVSRIAGGEWGKAYSWTAGGMRIRAPSLDIHTVAAGGGSLCRLAPGRLTVGPESAGSDPGPLCYGKGRGDGGVDGNPVASGGAGLTVTDVNLFLGRLAEDYFPFPLHREPVERKLEELKRSWESEGGGSVTTVELAQGFLEIVDRQMAQAIKEISLSRGHEPGEHALVVFGGAGGQHACAVARLLGIRAILIHPLAGVLSALGMGLAETRWEGSAPVDRLPLNAASLAVLEPVFSEMESRGLAALSAQGNLAASVTHKRRLDLRYAGTEHALAVARPPGDDWRTAFEAEHRELYGYTRPGRTVEILQARVESRGAAEAEWPRLPPRPQAHPGYGVGRQSGSALASPLPRPVRHAVLHDRHGRRDAPVFYREDLPAGVPIAGPALILDRVSTVVLEEDFRAIADEDGLLRLEPIEGSGKHVDPAGTALLELFNHAFMSIAGHMGMVLQRTAISTNVKERQDFSCAVFDADGNLIANAPHIPVHLGAMGESVRHILRRHPRPRPGDAYVTNNPYRGGSHLPDITVVTPVFLDASDTAPAFFTANRAHHADIGGTTPGSMPAFSSRLEEEGVLLDAELLVEADRFRGEEMREIFLRGPLPARNPAENLADLEAQVASNRAGARLLLDLIAEHGWERVRSHMALLRENAAYQVRLALARLPQGVRTFADAMDDGTPICVTVTLNGDGAVVDFAGTGPESEGNLNAPPAVVRSAVMYVLRCLVAERIPMNEGCLDPVRILIPERSILNPSPGRAVAGGNVETSQRVVDVLLGALGLAAASQGTMNNVSFGDGTFGYYETLAGGAGAAGPQGNPGDTGYRAGADGASAVHTHMTNTRITDPEVLETRYPVRLERFAIRRRSGGDGKWRGGDGVIREYLFLKTVEVSLLTQRRRLAPFGLAGGEAGAMGRNVRLMANGAEAETAGSTAYAAAAGERLRIETPGGGSWGGPGRSGPAPASSSPGQGLQDE
jgi:5-oxoprolinase (ATP-hydrolysing)